MEHDIDPQFYQSGITKLVTLLRTFGDLKDFDATVWIVRWLHEPLPAWWKMPD